MAFGSMFNNIYISRLDSSNVEIERIKVPISYGQQQKFIRRLSRIGTDFDSNKVKIENYLPRLSFEISNLSYDSSRKLNTMNRTFSKKSDGFSRTRFEKVPYNMDLTLGIMTKNTEDALQIIEQVLPYFQPEYTIAIKMNEIDQNVNVPIVFKNCTIGEGDDGSYGNYDTRKLTYATLQFSSKFYLYGPIYDTEQILLTSTNLFVLDSGLTLSTVSNFPNTGITAGNYVPVGPTAQTTITEYPL